MVKTARPASDGSVKHSWKAEQATPFSDMIAKPIRSDQALHSTATTDTSIAKAKSRSYRGLNFCGLENYSFEDSTTKPIKASGIALELMQIPQKAPVEKVKKNAQKKSGKKGKKSNTKLSGFELEKLRQFKTELKEDIKNCTDKERKKELKSDKSMVEMMIKGEKPSKEHEEAFESLRSSIRKEKNTARSEDRKLKRKMKRDSKKVCNIFFFPV